MTEAQRSFDGDTRKLAVIEEKQGLLDDVKRQLNAEIDAFENPAPKPPDPGSGPGPNGPAPDPKRKLSITERLKNRLGKGKDDLKRVLSAAAETKTGRLLTNLAEVGLKRGKNFVPTLGSAAGGASAAYALSQEDYATAYLEAAGASEIPVVAQAADIANLVNDVGGVLKKHLDPDNELEALWYEAGGTDPL